jgi:hypothetical protein
MTSDQKWRLITEEVNEMNNMEERNESGAANIRNPWELNERVEEEEARRARARPIKEIEAVEAIEADGSRERGGRRRVNAQQVEGPAFGARAEIMKVIRDHDLRIDRPRNLRDEKQNEQVKRGGEDRNNSRGKGKNTRET